MLKILKELGQMEGHFAVEIYEVEGFGLLAVDHDQQRRDDGSMEM